MVYEVDWDGNRTGELVLTSDGWFFYPDPMSSFDRSDVQKILNKIIELDKA